MELQNLEVLSSKEFSSMGETAQKLYLETRYGQLTEEKPKPVQYKSAKEYVAQNVPAIVSNFLPILWTALSAIAFIYLFRIGPVPREQATLLAGGLVFSGMGSILTPILAFTLSDLGHRSISAKIFAKIFLKGKIEKMQKEFDEKATIEEREYAVKLEAHGKAVEKLKKLQAIFLGRVNRGTSSGSLTFQKGKLHYVDAR